MTVSSNTLRKKLQRLLDNAVRRGHRKDTGVLNSRGLAQMPTPQTTGRGSELQK